MPQRKGKAVRKGGFFCGSSPPRSSFQETGTVFGAGKASTKYRSMV
jgi:hypothetical protein